MTTTTNDIEVWADIPDTDCQYYVSNHGRVCTVRRRPKVLTLTRQKSGYLYAMIEVCGKPKKCRVHRLVAQAFLPNPDHLTEINHKDGNKENNHVGNLEWATRSQNVKHSFDTGLKHPHRWTADERKRIAEKVRASRRERDTDHPRP